MRHALKPVLPGLSGGEAVAEWRDQLLAAICNKRSAQSAWKSTRTVQRDAGGAGDIDRLMPIIAIMVMVIIVVRGDILDDCAGHLIKEQLARLLVLPVEVEHVVERTCDRVERTARLNTLTVKPVIFDKPQHRTLVGQRVVNVILLRE